MPGQDTVGRLYAKEGRLRYVADKFGSVLSSTFSEAL